MQAPNVLADVNPSANRPPKERSTANERDSDFRDIQNRAREADRHERRRESTGQSPEGPRAVSGEKAETGSVKLAGDAPSENGLPGASGASDLEALKAQTGLSDEELQSLLVQTGLSEQDLQALIAGTLPEEVLTEKLAQLTAEEADHLLRGLQQTTVIQPAVTTQLASQNLGSNGSGRVQLDVPAVLQAALSKGQGADNGEQLLQMAVKGAGSADSAESGLGRNSDNSQLLQHANTALRTEVREPVGSLKHYTTSLETPVDDEETWNEKMAGKMSWLASKGLQSAEIHINPPELGPVEVRIQIQNDQASVSIQAQHSSVRDMLELNSHRLREMLEENGINLSSFDVSDQTAQQGQEGGNTNGDGQGRGRLQGEAATREGEAVTTGEAHMSWTQGVDLYA